MMRSIALIALGLGIYWCLDHQDKTKAGVEKGLSTVSDGLNSASKALKK